MTLPRARSIPTFISPTVAGAALALALITLHWGGFDAPFILDDFVSITQNPSLRNIGDLGAILSPPAGSTLAGRPVANLSFALNYALHGLAPAGYRLGNLAFHTVSALLLFGLVRRTLRRISPENHTRGEMFLAAGLALAWAIHPVQVATVHYIAQRTELLMGMFYLLTLYALCRALDGGRRGWLGVAIAACALGMASKEVMVTAPVLVLLYDRAFGAGSWREALTRRRLFYAALAATWLLLLPTFSGLGQRAVGFDMGIRWWQYALQETEALSTYLRLVVWPHPLVFDYGAAYFTRLLQAAPFAAVTATALAAVLLAWWRSPALGFGGLAFFVLLAPTSSVVPIVMQPIAESRLYLPLAAGLVALGTMAHLSLGRRARVGGILMLLALLPPTLHRVAIVGDSLQLAAETARQRPQNPRALSNLGQALMVANRLSAALPPLREAVRLDPGLEGPHVNLAALLNALEQPAEALEHALIAERIKPDAWFAHFHAGTALLKLGRVPEAVEQLRVEVALQPGFADAHNVLGAALYRLGQPAEAIPEFEAALRLNPRSAETQQNLASALTQLGRFDAAIALYREAQQMHPADQGIRTNLAIALTKAGRLEEAKREFQAVLRMQPDSPAALDGLRYIEGHLPSP